MVRSMESHHGNKKNKYTFPQCAPYATIFTMHAKLPRKNGRFYSGTFISRLAVWQSERDSAIAV